MKRGANIIAEYLGGAITCDAHHMTDPRADGLGVSSCIAKSLEDAGVSPEEVKMLYNEESNHFHNGLLHSDFEIAKFVSGELCECSCNINSGRGFGRGQCHQEDLQGHI